MDESKTLTEVYQNLNRNTNITENNLNDAFAYISKKEEVYCKGNKRSSGKRKQAREAYHFIQSFPKVLEIEPELVHHIGSEFEKRLGNEEFPYVCSCHMNTGCLNNHILMSAFNLDTLKIS